MLAGGQTSCGCDQVAKMRAAGDEERSLTSQVTRHTSHVTRHPSHVTRHKSPVTRHTSHISNRVSYILNKSMNRHQQTCYSCSHLYALKPCRTSNLALHTSHVTRHTLLLFFTRALQHALLQLPSAAAAGSLEHSGTRTWDLALTDSAERSLAGMHGMRCGNLLTTPCDKRRASLCDSEIAARQSRCNCEHTSLLRSA